MTRAVGVDRFIVPHTHMAGRLGQRRAYVRSHLRVRNSEENRTHLARMGIVWI